MRTIIFRVLVGSWLAAASLSCSRTPRESETTSDTTKIAQLTVSRPTVVAYFVVPDGAVDTMPDLAVRADDWNYAMATVGDSLEANGISFALITDSRVRLTGERVRDTTLTLGEPLSAGYVFVRPAEPPCVRRRPVDPDSVLTVARAVFAGGAVTSEWCQ